MYRAIATIAMLLAAGSASAEKPLAIKSIEARLFYNYSGTLSKPITGKTVLWNAIIGEGNIDEPSNSTLVDVTVEGAPGSFDPDLRLELVVSDSSSGKIVLRQSVRSACSMHPGNITLDSGCPRRAVSRFACAHGLWVRRLPRPSPSPFPAANDVLLSQGEIVAA